MCIHVSVCSGVFEIVDKGVNVFLCACTVCVCLLILMPVVVCVSVCVCVQCVATPAIR